MYIINFYVLHVIVSIPSTRDYPSRKRVSSSSPLSPATMVNVVEPENIFNSAHGFVATYMRTYV